MSAKADEFGEVGDSIAKVGGELAVGSDLQFQRRWWRLERAFWVLFSLMVTLDLTGAFGRGFLAQAQREAADGSIVVHYERIERYDTPSLLTVKFQRPAAVDGKIWLWVNGTLAADLGNQRVVPQPALSQLRDDGFAFQFPFEGTGTGQVQFVLQPSRIGVFRISIGQPGKSAVTAKIVVLP